MKNGLKKVEGQILVQSTIKFIIAETTGIRIVYLLLLIFSVMMVIGVFYFIVYISNKLPHPVDNFPQGFFVQT